MQQVWARVFLGLLGIVCLGSKAATPFVTPAFLPSVEQAAADLRERAMAWAVLKNGVKIRIRWLKQDQPPSLRAETEAGWVGDLEMVADGSSLELPNANTHSDWRKNGIHQLLMEAALVLNPSVTRITGKLAFTNYELATEALGCPADLAVTAASVLASVSGKILHRHGFRVVSAQPAILSEEFPHIDVVWERI